MVVARERRIGYQLTRCIFLRLFLKNKRKNRKTENKKTEGRAKKTKKQEKRTERSTERRRGAWLKKKKKFAERREACLRGGKEEKLLRSAPQRRAQTREITANDNFLQFFSSSSVLLLLLSKRCVYIVWCISRFLCVFFVIDERWEIGGVSINRADVLAHSTDFSLSLIPIGETTFTRARAIYA